MIAVGGERIMTNAGRRAGFDLCELNQGPGRMGATLDALHRLQDVEMQLAGVRNNVERRHRAVRRQENHNRGLEAELDAKREALRRDQMDADALDVEMKAHDASIAKLRQSLNQAKTNKEYSAILTQLNTEKADNSKLEERVMTLLTEIEAKKADIMESEEALRQEVAKLESFRSAAAAAEEKARDRLERLQAERDQAASAVPPGALELFDRVAKKSDGEALAMVKRTHPKREEYVCDGCNMSITIEQVNAITSRDEAVVCNICGRILYMESQAASRA